MRCKGVCTIGCDVIAPLSIGIESHVCSMVAIYAMQMHVGCDVIASSSSERMHDQWLRYNRNIAGKSKAVMELANKIHI